MNDDSWTMIHNRVADDRRLTTTQLAVYLALCRHAHRATATISIPALARSARCAQATVKRALQTLADLGYVTRQHGGATRAGQTPATYTIGPLAAHYAAHYAAHSRTVADTPRRRSSQAHSVPHSSSLAPSPQLTCAPSPRLTRAVTQLPTELHPSPHSLPHGRSPARPSSARPRPRVLPESSAGLMTTPPPPHDELPTHLIEHPYPVLCEPPTPLSVSPHPAHSEPPTRLTEHPHPAHSEPPIKEQDYTRLNKTDSARASLTSDLNELYTSLVGHEPRPAIAQVLAAYRDELGEGQLAAMLRESYDATGAITPATLAVARRKLGPHRRGKTINLPTPSMDGRPADADAAPPLPDEPHPAWRAVLEEARWTMTRENYLTWFYPTRVVDAADDHLTISVPSDLHADWLQHRLANRIAIMLRRAGHAPLRIDYVVQHQSSAIS